MGTRARPEGRRAATRSASVSRWTASRVAAIGFEASGCGAMIAAGSAAVTLVAGRPLLEAARVGAGALDAELGGLIPGKRHAVELAADALHRALGRPRAGRARAPCGPGARSWRSAAGSTAPWRRCCWAGRGGEVAAVTLELWADDGNDGSRSCCSAQRRAHRPRRRPRPRPAASDARPARGVPRGRGRPLARGPRGGRDAESLRALQRARAPGRHARRSPSAWAPRRWRPATTRASPKTATARCCAPPPTRAKDQSYMLCRARARVAGAAALPARRAAPSPRCASSRAEAGPGGREPAPTPRTSASWPAPPRRVPRAPRRLRADARARSSTAAGRRARPPPRPSPLHGRPAPRPRRRGARAALRAGHRRARQPRGGRPARGAAQPSACAVRDARAAPRRPRASTGSSCATARRRWPRPGGRAPRPISSSRSSEPVLGAAPGPARLPARRRARRGLRHDRAGRALARLGRVTSDEIRETFLAFFEERDHRRLPLRLARSPPTYDPSVLLTTAGMHPLKPYFLGQEHAARTTGSRAARSASAPSTSRRSGTTTRHLTFFEMLGNFSIGDYFKAGRGRVRAGSSR